MGVIPINFSPEVEVFIKGSRKGTRSAVVDHVMKKYLRAQLSDSTAATIEDSSNQQLTMACINRFNDISQFDKEWLDRALVLRDVFLKHLEEKA